MRQRILTGLVISSILITSTAFARVASIPKPILIQPYQHQIQVRLAANPTTGYLWAIENYPHQYLTLNGYHFIPGNTRLMGAPGTAVFDFKVKPALHVAPIKTELHFVYMQPWNLKTQTQQPVVLLSIPEPAQKPAIRVKHHHNAVAAPKRTQSKSAPLMRAHAMPHPAAPTRATQNLIKPSTSSNSWLSVPSA